MKQQLIKVAIILALLFIAGGAVAVFQGLEVIGQVFVRIIPLFAPAFKQALQDYLTSAYFIVSVILIILSSFGIYLSVRHKKCLYAVVSIIVDLLSLISLITNLAVCN